MGKKKSATPKVCGACANFKKGRCTRKDKKRAADDPACGSFRKRA